MPQFTTDQRQAIDLDNSSIIVSAGAGSGKTAVLSERVIRKLNDGVDINRLLILTFTKEAAKEMKNRIRMKIIKNNNAWLIVYSKTYNRNKREKSTSFRNFYT